MAKNGTVTPTVWTDPTLTASVSPIRKIHMDELRTALNRLDTLKVNAINCNCTVVWTCQSNCYSANCSNCNCSSCGDCG